MAGINNADEPTHGAIGFLRAVASGAYRTQRQVVLRRATQLGVRVEWSPKDDRWAVNGAGGRRLWDHREGLRALAVLVLRVAQEAPA